MRNYKEGVSRDQLVLFRRKLDDIISQENPVRFIDMYVDSIDMKELGFLMPKSNMGAPSYRRTDLLKLYIYGYLERIRSSRKLEKECNRNDELRWLIFDLAPDFKTIANFRKDNKNALKNLYRIFLIYCKKLKLISYEMVGIDGTKIRAQNSSNNVYHRDTISYVEKSIDEKINNYLKELDRQDEIDEINDISILPNKEIIRRMNKLKNRKEKINFIKDIFKNNPELQTYFGNDQDSRFQKDKGQSYVGYNCQMAVDNKNKLIVEAEVTNKCNDQQQLANMAEKIKTTKEYLGIKRETIIVADAGYYSEQEIIKAEEYDNIDTYIIHTAEAKKANDKVRHQKQNKKNKVPTDDYKIEKFEYNEKSDLFICPEGKRLLKNGKTKYDKRRNLKVKNYYCNECNNCFAKKRCTISKRGRYLAITENYITMRDYKKKVLSEKGKRLTNKRKEIVEHPFGTIKSILGYNSFIQSGIENSDSEFKFIAFIYNFKRVLNLISFNDLVLSFQTS